MNEIDLFKTARALLLQGRLCSKIVGVFVVNEMLTLLSRVADKPLQNDLAFVLPSTLAPYNFANEGLVSLFSKRDCVHSASVVFLTQKVSLKPSFISLADSQFGMRIFDLHDTALSSEEKLATLNKFVSTHTNGEIEQFFDSAKEIENTPLGLLNASYFALNWKTPFEAVRTRRQVFFGLFNKQKETDFMKGEQRIAVKTTEHFEAVELPFEKEDKVTLVLVKPLSDFEQFLRSFDFAALFAEFSGGTLKKEFVNLVLPKFSIRTRVDLSEAVKQLGARGAFERAGSLVGLAEEDILVKKVIQETLIEVNETGIKVACATAVEMLDTAMSDFSEKKIVFDRPFLFFVVSGEKVLFAGSFTDVDSDIEQKEADALA